MIDLLKGYEKTGNGFLVTFVNNEGNEYTAHMTEESLEVVKIKTEIRMAVFNKEIINIVLIERLERALYREWEYDKKYDDG